MTSKNHQVIDLGRWLHQADADAVADGVAAVAGIQPGATAKWEMLCLSPNARWSAPDVASETTALVLEGVGTFSIEDWRYSAATGHLLVAGHGAPMSVVNDGKDVMRALVCTIAGSAPT